MNHAIFTSILLALALSVKRHGFLDCTVEPATQAANQIDKSGSLKNEPAVTFKDLHGNNVPLSSLKGKVVLVNFWATWCDPCSVEIPWMIEFQQKYSSQGFTMLGVAMDDEGAEVVAPFVQKTQFDVNGHPTTMDYPIVIGDDDIAEQIRRLDRVSHQLFDYQRRKNREEIHGPRKRR